MQVKSSQCDISNQWRFLFVSVFFLLPSLFEPVARAELPSRCLMNSDCVQGMVCRTGQCGVECREDRDCAGSGLLFACTKTVNADLAESVGGGKNAFQCVPRGGFPEVAPLPKLYPVISDVNLVGPDLWTFANFHADPQVCAAECAKFREECKAWVMYGPDVKGTYARCYLKKSVSSTEDNQGSTWSGYID